MDSFEKMLSVKEVAGVPGVSRDSVVRLVSSARLLWAETTPKHF
jgi:hypothetical protein